MNSLNMLAPSLKKNDKQAHIIIGILSVVVFVAVIVLGKVTVNVNLGFNPHIFAAINAYINSILTVLLIVAFIAVKQRKFVLHKRLMLTNICLSAVFLISYICHHLFTESTSFGDVSAMRYVYYTILVTHIILAALILPFILYTSYHSLTGDYKKHKKLARITWPIWLYVAITGVVVYLMISPYYV